MATTLYTYRRFRKAGYNAAEAYRNAKTFIEFSDRDDVQIRMEDEQDSYFDVYGEPESDDERDEIRKLLERWGCVIAEYRDNNGEWQQADSIGMCVYHNPIDPLQNCYVPDLMQAAIIAADEQATAASI